jgi:NADH-quinone oxidoreductase subunit G
MIKEAGEWKTVDWPVALEFVTRGLKTIVDRHGGPALGTLVSPHATLEEMALAAGLTRALGSDNIDFRLRQSDFRGDGHSAGFPWLGMPIAELDSLDRVLVIGSFLRKDHPLAAQRLRHAARKGAEISLVLPWRTTPASKCRIRWSPCRRSCRRRSPRSSSLPRMAQASLFPRRSRRSSPGQRRK